ncbi:MAG: Asp-tRNA(Asn)/Glu-tRNA(Gln) amidotransferase subunit GatB [Spirochaetales bacterium]|nr:Asp-tRNA(Asn)/Glu-tRNA(Gln) amidotransferase subunit GatB [Spirochaetales bacterium]
MKYESFIGLEVHIHLLTESKVFCSCSMKFGNDPNTNVCPVCLGYPGVLPVLNEQAVKYSYMVCKALNCELSRHAVFERKNYFYPDMTKNYQISQFEHPFGKEGGLDFEVDGGIRRIRIHDIHLEEDAGKMIHEGEKSYLDYNRAGSSLLEIVTMPDFKTGEEAESFLQYFRRLVRYLGVCDGNMEEGSLRCDANVSINLPGKGLGRKVEIKNLNSSRFVKLALNHEIKRQARVIDGGGTIVQETRLWNEAKSITESMRTKEAALDYRYFPEPDLPPFRPDDAFFRMIDSAMTELPLERKKRMAGQYGLDGDVLDFLTDEKERADFFEETVGLGADARICANWLRTDVAKELNRLEAPLSRSPLTAKRLASLLGLLNAGTIHGRIAKQTLEIVFAEDKDPEKIIKEKGWDNQAGSDELEAVVQNVLAENPDVCEQIKSGDPKPRGFLVGQVMKATAGSADPKLVQELLTRLLK